MGMEAQVIFGTIQHTLHVMPADEDHYVLCLKYKSSPKAEESAD